MAAVTVSLLILLVLLGGAGYWLKRSFAVALVVGPSMLPALAPDDKVLARRRPLLGPHVGQIVVIRRPALDSPRDPAAESDPVGPDGTTRHPPWIVKRVAATAGTPVRPEWVPAEVYDDQATVPVGMLVLLGDNADDSHDSRHVGYYPVRDVLGVVVRRMS